MTTAPDESAIADVIHSNLELLYNEAGLDYDCNKHDEAIVRLAWKAAGDIEAQLHERLPVLREAVHHGGWLWPSGHNAIIPSDLFGYIAYADGDEVNPVGTFSSEGAAVKAIGARL